MKYVTEKVIKGKPYFYLQYGNVSHYLGAHLPDDLKREMALFFSSLQAKKESSSELQKEFPYGALQKIEDSHYWYVLLSHPFFAKERADYNRWFTIVFTFNSNRAEGSKVTQPEIEKFANSLKRKPKTRTEQEILNSFQALEFAFSNQMKWNLKSIQVIHRILLTNLDPLIAGKWKNQNNVAPGNQPTADFKSIPHEMKSLLLFLKNSFRKKIYPPLIALQFYCRFEKIHPFLDGNGRTGRILLNAILSHADYLPVIFFSQNHEEHCTAICQALQGRFSKIQQHFSSQLEKSRKRCPVKF